MSRLIQGISLPYRAVRWAIRLIAEGKTRVLLADAWTRLYKQAAAAAYAVSRRWRGRLPGPPSASVRLETEHPVAYESPDHEIPFGTSRDNSTNKRFVAALSDRLHAEFEGARIATLDLGCSGGQLVQDFLEAGFVAVGLEGSDYSLKAGRANWPALAGRNLFTCDVTHPFRLLIDGAPATFHLVTMWEVLEHIPTNRLPALFDNIAAHLEPGGYFVASTTSEPDVHGGVDLHQTKWTNAAWRAHLAETHPDWQWVDLGLRFYEMVRLNAEGSYLTYRRVR